MRRLLAVALALVAALPGAGATAATVCDPGRAPECCCGNEGSAGPSIDAACPCGCEVAPAVPDRRPDSPIRTEPPPTVETAPPAVAETIRVPAFAERADEGKTAPPAESPPLFLLHRDLRF